ncbi:MAG: hypothetical protein JWM68_4764 [Verrucomicrobiales bacterium]|nr:hypothetical protein [Verrucomicrobiales bacterium]
MTQTTNAPIPAHKRKTSSLIIKATLVLPLCFMLGGCMTASKHVEQLGSNRDRALTVGLVQKQIKVGMAQPDVAAALGSPNIVTGDNQKRETWIYDKIASEFSYSNDSGGVSSMVSGTGNFPAGNGSSPSGSMTGNINGSYSKAAGATSVTQHTLTVVIKFSPENTVESVSYNSTRF